MVAAAWQTGPLAQCLQSPIVGDYNFPNTPYCAMKVADLATAQMCCLYAAVPVAVLLSTHDAYAQAAAAAEAATKARIANAAVLRSSSSSNSSIYRDPTQYTNSSTTTTTTTAESAEDQLSGTLAETTPDGEDALANVDPAAIALMRNDAACTYLCPRTNELTLRSCLAVMLGGVGAGTMPQQGASGTAADLCVQMQCFDATGADITRFPQHPAGAGRVAKDRVSDPVDEGTTPPEAGGQAASLRLPDGHVIHMTAGAAASPQSSSAAGSAKVSADGAPVAAGAAAGPWAAFRSSKAKHGDGAKSGINPWHAFPLPPPPGASASANADAQSVSGAGSAPPQTQDAAMSTPTQGDTDGGSFPRSSSANHKDDKDENDRDDKDDKDGKDSKDDKDELPPGGYTVHTTRTGGQIFNFDTSCRLDKRHLSPAAIDDFSTGYMRNATSDTGNRWRYADRQEGERWAEQFVILQHAPDSALQSDPRLRKLSGGIGQAGNGGSIGADGTVERSEGKHTASVSTSIAPTTAGATSIVLRALAVWLLTAALCT